MEIAIQIRKRPYQPAEDSISAPAESSGKGKLVAAAGEASAPPPPPVIPPVVLNALDCDLDFDVEGDGLLGSALYEEGFRYCWSGARANVGITGGKFCFGCKITANQPVNMSGIDSDSDTDQQHLCRVGVSRGDVAVGGLGESQHSFFYESTGMFYDSGLFPDYGERFRAGDTVVCCVDLDSNPAIIEFSRNGKWMGIASVFDADSLGLGVLDCPSALFPHILLKNVEVEMQFSAEDGLVVPEEGYKPWASAPEDGNGLLGPTFQDVNDCEVIMMVGLPGSGKSTWAKNWVKDHPEKRYVLLGTDSVLDQMKVPGYLRNNNCNEQFESLMNRATKMFYTLLSRASVVPRNYIIDQTNLKKNHRKHRLRPFVLFNKIAVVMFPSIEEFKIRAGRRLRETGKEVQEEEVNDMLGKYSLPLTKCMQDTEEYFDEVRFPELSRAESEAYLSQMQRDLTLYWEVYRNRGKGVVQTPFGAPRRNYQNYVENSDAMAIDSTPSHGAPPHGQGNFTGHLNFRDLGNSYSIRNPEDPGAQWSNATPSHGPPYGTSSSRPHFPRS